MSIQARVERITPAKARKMLENNRGNRPIRQEQVVSFTESMKAGAWKLNGESIKLDKHNNIVDGQHRLEAIVAANMTIDILVVRGLEPEAYHTIDKGRGRTLADTFHHNGVQHYAAVAAATAWLHRYKTNTLHDLGCRRMRTEEALDLLEQHPRLADSVPKARHAWKAGVLGVSIGAFCHYLFSQVDPEKADTFFEKLASGENLRKTQAVYQLRERLRQHHESKAKLRGRDIVALCFLAWQHHTNGDCVKQLRLPTGEYPTVKGAKV